MRKPLLISLLFHAAILLLAVVTFPSFGDKAPPRPTPLPVDLVTPAELTKIKAGKRDAEKETAKAEEKPEPPAREEKPEPKKVKTVKAPEPKASKVKTVKAPEPSPEKAEPAPTPKAKAEKPEKKVAKAEPHPVPQRKPTPPRVKREELKPEPEKVVETAARSTKKKEDFDPDKIAALLNKAPDAGPQRTAAAEPENKPEPAKGRSDGRDMQMTFNEIDALRARISQCWNPPVGGLGADAIQVKLRLQLTEQGSLSASPQVMNRAGSPFFQAAADAAVRAVMLCQPYQLPPQKYALWRDMILNFDPREMFGG